MSFLYCGTQKCTQCSRWSQFSTEQRGTIFSLDWLGILVYLVQPLCIIYMNVPQRMFENKIEGKIAQCFQYSLNFFPSMCWDLKITFLKSVQKKMRITCHCNRTLKDHCLQVSSVPDLRLMSGGEDKADAKCSPSP